MRKITVSAYSSFINRRRFTKDNTKVRIDERGDAHMYLFGNEIAKTEGSDILISKGGYRCSKSTRERLSAFIKIRLWKGEFVIGEKFIWKEPWLNITKLAM